MFKFLDMKDHFKIVEHTISLNHFQKLVKFEVSQCLGQGHFEILQSNVTEAQKRILRERRNSKQGILHTSKSKLISTKKKSTSFTSNTRDNSEC